jgi:signal transduction histidine kinase
VTPKTAVVFPLTDKADDQLVGTLVLGVDPLLTLDDRYSEFLALVSEAVAARMSEAHARQREHQRLQRLAELDRAKTEFFSNVSHEFRTPLTLMLGPLEDARRDADAVPRRLRDELELARRNARRLLRLVGTMLDFSQIEAGRLRARFARSTWPSGRATSSPSSRAPLPVLASNSASTSTSCPTRSGWMSRCGRRSSPTCSQRAQVHLRR